MKARHLLLLLLMTTTLTTGFILSSSFASAAGKEPNVLEIVRGSSGTGGEQGNVTQAQLVRDIYHTVLALPKRSARKVCPLYLTAQYQLTFLHSGSSVLKVQAQQGGCPEVIISKSDIRVANAGFWSLLAHTHEIGNVRVAGNAPDGLTPSDLQSAYGLPSATAGKGQTVAIVDAYNDPYAEANMRAYRSMFGLPACTSANHCFKRVNQFGSTHYPKADQDWSGEIALDLDMVSAICPNCHILLVEASSSSFNDLGTAVTTAVRLGANVISNSYGGQEDGQSAQSVAHYYNHPGVIITASSGDNGYGVQLPAAFQSVVAVGGTSLSRAENTRGWNEVVWNGSGSGCSQYVSKPDWQQDQGCSNRTVADVSAVADPATGVAVYNTYGGGGWAVYGGTSASSPIVASTFALAGNATKINASYLYSHTANLNPVIEGSNGSCSPAYLCTAGPGYNGPAGLGTPNGTGAF